MRAVPFVLAFALMLYAFIDCARTPREELPAGLSRLVWVLFILLGVGALVWVVLRVAATVNAAGTAGPRPTGPTRPAGPVAPDDDPPFRTAPPPAGAARARDGRRPGPAPGRRRSPRPLPTRRRAARRRRAPRGQGP